MDWRKNSDEHRPDGFTSKVFKNELQCQKYTDVKPEFDFLFLLK